MDASERMKKLLLELRLSPEKLAASFGKSRGDIIRNVLAGKNGISNNLVFLITSIHKNINPEWLLNGKGNMLLSDDEIKEQAVVPNKNNCQLCKEKDFIIDEYKKIISAQTKLIDELTKK